MNTEFNFELLFFFKTSVPIFLSQGKLSADKKNFKGNMKALKWA